MIADVSDEALPITPEPYIPVLIGERQFFDLLVPSFNQDREHPYDPDGQQHKEQQRQEKSHGISLISDV